jgi:hypothetical protein
MVKSISASVGKIGTNLSVDVITIKQLLNKVPAREEPPKTALDEILPETSDVDQTTIEAIKEFQRRHAGMLNPDGRVDRNGKTLAALNEFDGPTPPPQPDPDVFSVTKNGVTYKIGQTGNSVVDLEMSDSVLVAGPWCPVESVEVYGKLLPDRVPSGRYRSKFIVSDARTSPARFVVVYPEAVSDMQTVNYLFHGNPGFAGYNDATYFNDPKWYADYADYHRRLGPQLTASGKNWLMIVPLLRGQDLGNTGNLASEWFNIATACKDLILNHHGVSDGSGTFTNLVLSGFSAGVKYLDSFMHKGEGYSEFLQNIHIFDGTYSSYRDLVTPLRRSFGPGAIVYDQVETSGRTFEKDVQNGLFHIGQSRWAGTPSGDSIHQWAIRHLYTHAILRSV